MELAAAAELLCCIATCYRSLSLDCSLSAKNLAGCLFFLPCDIVGPQLAPAIGEDVRFIEQLGLMLRTRSAETGEVQIMISPFQDC